MRKRIYILRQCLADNIQAKRDKCCDRHYPDLRLDPVTVVDFPDDEDVPPLACHEVEVHGPSRLVYDPDAPKAREGHPLTLIRDGVAPLGTKVWLETTAELTIVFWDHTEGRKVRRTVY